MANVEFNIYNRNETELLPMTGYALSFEVFKYVANFTTTTNDISDKKVVWNFGDNTTSTDLTGFHAYAYPGNYQVSLTVFNSGGNGLISTYLSSVKIDNYINDAIILTTDGAPVQISGQDTNKIYLTRYNSHQTSISGYNDIINIAVSGNRSPFFTADEYDNDKNSHFYSTSRFAIATTKGLTTVDSISTTNDFIYASPAGDDITISSEPGIFSVVAGSSGVAAFYYIEDFQLTS